MLWLFLGVLIIVVSGVMCFLDHIANPSKGDKDDVL